MGDVTGDFERYFDSLVGSWEALAVPQQDAVVIRGAGFVAARFPDPVLNNAVVLDAGAVPAARQVFAAEASWALWSLDAQPEVAAAIAADGLHADEATVPMVLALSGAVLTPGAVAVVTCQTDTVAALNGGSASLLREVPGLRAYCTADGQSGLVTIDVGTDLNVSWVATSIPARGQGLASAVLAAALLDGQRRGLQTASLQATPRAAGLYSRMGFRPVGRWQEWVPAG